MLGGTDLQSLGVERRDGGEVGEDLQRSVPGVLGLCLHFVGLLLQTLGQLLGLGLVDLAARPALALQSLQQQLVSSSRRVVRIFSDLLDLIGVHFDSLVGQVAGLLSEQRHVVRFVAGFIDQTLCVSHSGPGSVRLEPGVVHGAADVLQAVPLSAQSTVDGAQTLQQPAVHQLLDAPLCLLQSVLEGLVADRLLPRAQVIHQSLELLQLLPLLREPTNPGRHSQRPSS
ncbi:hypothetical protein F7725_010856 [Dissostichus mawsoni]|uniref:Uncharacterized protein n=1 Tax=Dissostichus mawsoni TaxID=36200 RepID=A0A7J5Z7B6_DISMA|nr:hypothetical protein F7725_010856 [Dissostichus mawsoni]